MSLERQVRVEATLRNVETCPNWQAKERIKRLNDLRHAVENGLPAPPHNEVTPPEHVPQMLAAIDGFIRT